MSTWFAQLFGEPEGSWDEVRASFGVQGDQLVAPNGRRFGVGRFTTPTLGALREQAQQVGVSGPVQVSHHATGDVLELHADLDQRGAMFQVASQMNCLEFPSPSTVPEDGVTGYAYDPTQGPACSLAAAAATVYRNYFVPIGAHTGQTASRQIDLTADLAALLGAPDAYFSVRNGYTFSAVERLAGLSQAMQAHDRADLLDALRIGVQTGVEVSFGTRFAAPPAPTTVSQAFCSAVSCGYVHDVPLSRWEPLATLVLDAAYEATLWAAVLDVATGQGSGRVWLTFVGGGVFGNRPEWIAGAIRRAIRAVQGFALDVRIAHYRAINGDIAARVDGTGGPEDLP